MLEHDYLAELELITKRLKAGGKEKEKEKGFFALNERILEYWFKKKYAALSHSVEKSPNILHFPCTKVILRS